MTDDGELRRRAEAIVSEDAASTDESLADLSPGEVRGMVHELRVQLEMRHEALRRTQEELAVARTHARLKHPDPLRATEDAFQDFLDHFPDPITLSRASDGVIVMANKAWTDITGLRLEDAVGRHPGTLGAWADPQGRDALVAEVQQCGRIAARPSIVRRPDGTERNVLITASTLRFQGQELVMIIGKDVSEGFQVEAELKLSEARFRALFQLLPVGVTVTDPCGHIILTNPASESLLGIPSDDLLRRDFQGPYWDIIRPDGSPMPSAEYASVRALKESRRVDNVEMGVRRPDGRVSWILVSAEPAQDAGLGAVIVYSDISRRKQVEEELDAARRRLSSVLESAGDVIAMMDRQFCYTVFNTAFRDEFQKVFGVSIREGDSMAAALARLPEDLAHARSYWGRALAGEDFTVEQQFGDPNLCRQWYELHFSPIRDVDDVVSGAVHVVRNVTERKQLEERLKHIVREREIILDTANVGLSLVVDRKQVWVNRWVEEVFQRSMHEIVGQSTVQFYPSHEAYERLGQEAYPILSRGEVYESLQELVRKDGHHIWVHYNGKALDPHDLSKGVLWILTDVTDKKEADDFLRASEARFRSMFESHSAVMLMVDPEDRRIIDANPAASAFYGYGREELRAMRVSDIDTADNGVAESSLLGAATRTRIFQHRLASGEKRMVDVHSSPTEVLGREMLFSIIFDVTDRVRLEQELRHRQRDLEMLNESLERRVQDAVSQLRAKDRILITQNRQAAMGEMIGNIAHQWRQPLNTLSLVLANIKDAHDLGALDSLDLQQSLERGNALIQKMSSTINDFRNFFRPDKSPTLFSALQQVQETVEMVKPGLGASHITLHIEAPEDVRIFGFPNEYGQVLLNLISNARQAIVEGGRAAGRIDIRLFQDDGHGCLSVRDDGGGVAEEHLDRIFEPYFSTRRTGTGIGLYMSRQIIEESMKGRIIARNVEGGAELVVRVPVGGGES